MTDTSPDKSHPGAQTPRVKAIFDAYYEKEARRAEDEERDLWIPLSQIERECDINMQNFKATNRAYVAADAKIAELHAALNLAGKPLSAIEAAGDPFNCPKCGAHDFGLNRPSCPHCGYKEPASFNEGSGDIAKNTPREAVKAHGGTTDAGANEVPTPGSFGGLENREEVIAKPATFYCPAATHCLTQCASCKWADDEKVTSSAERISDALKFAARFFEQYGVTHLAHGETWTGYALAEALLEAIPASAKKELGE